jgi:hypothetical protein
MAFETGITVMVCLLLSVFCCLWIFWLDCMGFTSVCFGELLFFSGKSG